MSKRAVLIAGSPSQNSRSTALLTAFGRVLAERSWHLETYSTASFPPEALLHGEFKLEPVARFAARLAAANAVILSTPVYKATYAGALKVIVDLIDPNALVGKAVLAIASARLEGHLSEVDASFQRLYAFFRDVRGLPSLALPDSEVGPADALALSPNAQRAFEEAVQRVERAAS